MEKKSVYGIYQGCIYEGGGCTNTVYSTIELAREEALKLVAKEQKDLVKMRRSCKKDGYIPDFYKEDWTETHPNRWHAVHDEILIQEFELITP